MQNNVQLFLINRDYYKYLLIYLITLSYFSLYLVSFTNIFNYRDYM